MWKCIVYVSAWEPDIPHDMYAIRNWSTRRPEALEPKKWYLEESLFLIGRILNR